MKILALEFSSSQRSAAVVVDGQARATVTQTGGRSVPAFQVIEEALKEAGFEREQIECVAVGLGPGSYTGIRAAIAIAQGWQLALGIKLAGISSVDAMVLQAKDNGWAGRVNLIVDAQRNEFYLARYELASGLAKELAPLKLATREEVTRILKSGEIVAGPDIQGFAGVHGVFPSAGAIGRLAAEHGAFVAGERLVPIYLREAGFVKAPPPRILPPG